MPDPWHVSHVLGCVPGFAPEPLQVGQAAETVTATGTCAAATTTSTAADSSTTTLSGTDLTINVTFQDLLGPTTASHIHSPTASPFSGTVDLSNQLVWVSLDLGGNHVSRAAAGGRRHAVSLSGRAAGFGP